MVLVWEGWGNQNSHGEDGLEPAPLDFPKMLWAQQVWAAGQREQAPPCCTSPGPGQAGIQELGTPSCGVQEDHGTASGRRFPTPLHPWGLLLCQGPMACTKLSEVPPSMKDAGKGDFRQDSQPWESGVPSLAPVIPFRLFCFLTNPYNNFCYHLTSHPPVLLRKMPIPGFGGGCFGIF